MRYALRNQKKIEQAYPGMLKRITSSLDTHFKERNKILLIESHEEFPLLYVSDVGHSVNEIVFYVIEIKFDVYRLAFKEFIG